MKELMFTLMMLNAPKRDVEQVAYLHNYLSGPWVRYPVDFFSNVPFVHVYLNRTRDKQFYKVSFRIHDTSTEEVFSVTKNRSYAVRRFWKCVLVMYKLGI